MHGYSKAAESDRRDIIPLCTTCLLARLENDYCNYGHRAVVVQPVTGLPCYVFRPKSEWDGSLQKELTSTLDKITGTCSSCGGAARYLWFDCILEPKIVADLPEKGLIRTLQTDADYAPASLCDRCLLQHIAQTLSAQSPGYLEVCGPHGDENGLIVAMGY